MPHQASRFVVIGTGTLLTVMGAIFRCVAAEEFNAAEQLDRWRDYQIIMWQPQTTAGYTTLRSIGFTGAALTANRAEPKTLPEAVEPLLQSRTAWYVENIATDFYSAYHRWFPDRPVNWRFRAVRELYRQNPNNPLA